MKRFIILFSEKEGTSALVRLLDNFDDVAIVGRTDRINAEPFDKNQCGPMRLGELRSCLDLIFGDSPVPMDTLNRVYLKTAGAPLAPIDNGLITGFKMRFRAPVTQPLGRRGRSLPAAIRKVARWVTHRRFKAMMMDVLADRGVVVFMAVRQDLMRWGLSKYHGDGSGGRGHLQFRVASGDLSRQDLSSITVDLDRLERVIRSCERFHEQKRETARELLAHGIPVYPLRYEDFQRDKLAYFRSLFAHLDTDVSETEIRAAVEQGA